MTHNPTTVDQIARAIGAEVEGDAREVIRSAAAIGSAAAGDITFAVDPHRAKSLADCQATAAVVGPDMQGRPGMTLLRVSDPQAAFARVLAMLAPPEDLPPAGVHPSATVDQAARLGDGVAVAANVVVGPGAEIGDNVVLCANVCLGANAIVGEGSILMPGVVVGRDCTIGQRCRIHPNAVIGADGFGYYFRDGVHHKITHAGTVEIGDDVEIGACSCVDRAKFGATRIGDGTKIDNLVQIAHNVQIGRGALLASLVGVAGSAELGDHVVLGGHAVIRDNVTVGSGVQVAGFSGIGQDTEAGQAVGGVPAFPMGQFLRCHVVYKKLPEMSKKLRQLQARLDALENRTEDDRP